MSPVADYFGGLLEETGADTALGRMLVYGEQRFWLLTALDVLTVREGGHLVASSSPEEWSALCQKWRLAVEDTARLVGGHETRSSYVVTVLAAAANAFLRIERPSVRFADLWCDGTAQRVEIGRAIPHGWHCACMVFDDAVASLEAAGRGENPWTMWAPSTESKAWAGLMGLCGHHVVRLVHGVATSLEEHAGFGHRSTVFEWGALGRPASWLGAAILEDAGAEADEATTYRFTKEVLLGIPGDQQFVLVGSEVAEWAAHRTRRGLTGRLRRLTER